MSKAEEIDYKAVTAADNQEPPKDYDTLTTMTKAERSIIERALDEIKAKEKDCFHRIAFLNEHKFEMERMAVQYEREAYTDSWLILSSAIDKLSKI